jgi:hypothetical protein
MALVSIKLINPCLESSSKNDFTMVSEFLQVAGWLSQLAFLEIVATLSVHKSSHRGEPTVNSTLQKNHRFAKTYVLNKRDYSIEQYRYSNYVVGVVNLMIRKNGIIHWEQKSKERMQIKENRG